MRILFLSDRIIGGISAYSKHTYEVATRLATLGHNIAHVPMGFANKMGIQVIQNIVIYDSGDHPFGEDIAIPRYLDFRADLLITNKEPWVFNEIYRWAINWVPMAIIDHSPISPIMTLRLQNAWKTIAISRHAERELKRKTIDCSYIPLGVRTDVYKPMDKAECKKAFYLEPDDFIIGVVAMNRARKMIPQMLKGYKRFIEMNPDIKAHLFLWTNTMPSRPPADISQGVADVGVNLLPEMHELGIGAGKNDVRWIKWDEVEKLGGIPEYDPKGKWDMVKLYNAFDVNMLCSGGEGAGMPYLESAACGVISLYTNYAAAPEYAGPTGIPVEAKDYVIMNTPGTRLALPDPERIAEALTKAYNADREALAKRTRLHAEQYSWENVIRKYWIPFLMECEEELYPKVSKEGLGTWA